MQDKIQDYLNLLDQWLKFYSFNEIKVNESAGTDRVYLRSRIEAAKFGNVDFYVCAKHVPNVTPEWVKAYSSNMFSLANRHRTGAPLGFGAMLQVFPLLITENITSETANFIKSSYCPKHFAASEFPSVIDLTTGYVYYYESTPIWGYAYYGGYRRDSYAFFSPEAWKKTAGTK